MLEAGSLWSPRLDGINCGASGGGREAELEAAAWWKRALNERSGSEHDPW